MASCFHLIRFVLTDHADESIVDLSPWISSFTFHASIEQLEEGQNYFLASSILPSLHMLHAPIRIVTQLMRALETY
jgi:hypothetical protein